MLTIDRENADFVKHIILGSRYRRAVWLEDCPLTIYYYEHNLLRA